MTTKKKKRRRRQRRRRRRRRGGERRRIRRRRQQKRIKKRSTKRRREEKQKDQQHQQRWEHNKNSNCDSKMKSWGKNTYGHQTGKKQTIQQKKPTKHTPNWAESHHLYEQILHNHVHQGFQSQQKGDHTPQVAQPCCITPRLTISLFSVTPAAHTLRHRPSYDSEKRKN